jgi:hypothetical protein
MEFELKSDWQDIQVELLKQLHGYKMKGIDKEIGSIDYIAEGEEDRKLLRVIVGPKFKASRALSETVADTLKKLEKEEYDNAILLASGFTNTSERMVREEDRLEIISPNSRYYSVPEILGAIQELTLKHCKTKCGAIPTKEEECKGLVDREYSCDVRRISDDADFHSRMGWKQLLMKDFSRMIDLS